MADHLIQFPPSPSQLRWWLLLFFFGVEIVELAIVDSKNRLGVITMIAVITGMGVMVIIV